MLFSKSGFSEDLNELAKEDSLTTLTDEFRIMIIKKLHLSVVKFLSGGWGRIRTFEGRAVRFTV